MERRLVREGQSWDFPPAAGPPLSLDEIPGPGLLLPFPAEAGGRAFQNGDGSQSPSSLDRWAGERVHSRATLVEELECLLNTLEIPPLAWELPSPLSQPWTHWPGTQGGIEAEPRQWGRHSACLAWHFLALVLLFLTCEIRAITIMAASHLESTRKRRSWALPIGGIPCGREPTRKAEPWGSPRAGERALWRGEPRPPRERGGGQGHSSSGQTDQAALPSASVVTLEGLFCFPKLLGIK